MTIKAPQFGSNPFLRSGAESPFAPAVPAIDDVPENAPEGSYAYAMVPAGPAIAPEECEADVASLEVVVSWGATVMHVAHLTPPRDFVIGEEAEKAPVDFAMPTEKLGAARLAIVAMKDGVPHLVVPAGATGTLTKPGQAARSLAELAGTSIAIGSEAKARVEIAGVVLEVAAVKAGRKVAGHTRLDARSLPFAGLSALVHIGVLAATALFMPPSALASEDGISDEQRYQLLQAMSTLAEHEQEHQEDLATLDQGQQGGQGERAQGEEGKMGSETSHNQNGRWGVKGPKENPDPHVSRAELMNDAQNGFMIGVLNSGLGGDRNAPIAVWGRDDSLGNDPISARGNMWGTDIAEAAGFGGLGLSGIGEGGGGLGFGIGLGKLGLGHGAGSGDGQGIGNCGAGPCGEGWGGHGHLMASHKVSTPSVRIGVASASGHLPGEVIQRIVRQNFGRYRACYESGLRTNPNLQGRVAVRFVIGRDGSVQSAANGGSDMPDAGVVSCVTRAFYGLSFPAPESGIVTVTYPIMFAPAGS